MINELSPLVGTTDYSLVSSSILKFASTYTSKLGGFNQATRISDAYRRYSVELECRDTMRPEQSYGSSAPTDLRFALTQAELSHNEAVP